MNNNKYKVTYYKNNNKEHNNNKYNLNIYKDFNSTENKDGNSHQNNSGKYHQQHLFNSIVEEIIVEAQSQSVNKQ